MEKIKVGKIVGTHALKGELKIRSHSDFAQDCLQKGNIVYLSYQKEWVSLEIINVRIHKGNYLVMFKGHQDINLVEKYIGCIVSVNQEEVTLAEGEYFIKDIKGSKVYTENRECIGEVQSIYDNGRHDVLVIEGVYGKVSIPYVDAFVIEENIEKKEIIVRLIAGMINEN